MQTMIFAERYHDISCGHRVVGHESKCALLHGHNYRIHFTCEAGRLDNVGRVIDFSAIKSSLCMWLEEHWDHKFLAFEDDQLIRGLCNQSANNPETSAFWRSIVWVSFNPTAENIAKFLLEEVGPSVFRGTGVRLIKVRVDETRKCSATAVASA